MKFILYEDKTVDSYGYVGKSGKPSQVTWVEAGVYPVIRMFDNDRVMVDLSSLTSKPLITLLKLKDGELSRG